MPRITMSENHFHVAPDYEGYFRTIPMTIGMQDADMDVVVHCNDQTTVMTNKLLLSYSSPFLQTLFKTECDCSSFIKFKYHLICPEFDPCAMKAVLNIIKRGESTTDRIDLDVINNVKTIIDCLKLKITVTPEKQIVEKTGNYINKANATNVSANDNMMECQDENIKIEESNLDDNETNEKPFSNDGLNVIIHHSEDFHHDLDLIKSEESSLDEIGSNNIRDDASTAEGQYSNMFSQDQLIQDSQFKCTECGLTYDDKHSLDDHKKTHSDEMESVSNINDNETHLDEMQFVSNTNDNKTNSDEMESVSNTNDNKTNSGELQSDSNQNDNVTNSDEMESVSNTNDNETNSGELQSDSNKNDNVTNSDEMQIDSNQNDNKTNSDEMESDSNQNDVEKNIEDNTKSKNSKRKFPTNMERIQTKHRKLNQAIKAEETQGKIPEQTFTSENNEIVGMTLNPPRDTTTHSNGKYYQCHICNVTQKYYFKLLFHYEKEHFKTKIANNCGSLNTCKICNNKFRQKDSLVLHLVNKHKLLKDDIPPECVLRIQTVTSQLTDSAVKKTTVLSPETESAGKRQTVTSQQTESAVKKKTVATPQKKSAVKKKTVATPHTESAVKKQTVATPQIKSAVKKQTVTTPQTKSAVKKKTVSLPQRKSAVKKKTVATPQRKSAVKKKTVATPQTKSAVKKQTVTTPQTKSAVKKKILSQNKFNTSSNKQKKEKAKTTNEVQTAKNECKFCQTSKPDSNPTEEIGMQCSCNEKTNSNQSEKNRMQLTHNEEESLPSVEEVCENFGLTDVHLNYTDADFKNVTTYKIFRQKFQQTIQDSNQVGLPRLMMLVAAKWREFSGFNNASK